MDARFAVKDRKFLEKYLENRPLAECAKYAGSKAKDSNSLKVVGSQMLSRLNLDMRDILDLHGVTDSYMAVKIYEGLNAERHTYAIYKGKIMDERKDPDNAARMKALETAARMKGKFVDKMEVSGPGGGDMTLVIAPATGSSKKKGVVEIE